MKTLPGILCAASCLAGILSPPHMANAQATADAPAASASSVPDDYKDAVTGARVIRLSKDPKTPAGVIYFTQPCITPDSRYALVRYLDPSAGHTAGHMYRYDFNTGELTKLTDIMTKNQVMAPKSGNMYFTGDADTSIYCTNIYSLKTRKVAAIPPEYICSAGLTVNADETVVVGTGNLSSEHKNDPILTTPPNQGSTFTNTFSKHDTNLVLAADIKTGKVTELHRINTWLGHPQFSPTDPNLLLYCHEGPWAQVDRMWTLRLNDKAPPQNVLKRTENNEIAGHEFWQPDGSAIWYDHNFRNNPSKHYLEGKNVTTGQVTKYDIVPPFGSIHYTWSPDGKFFVCDGGANRRDPSQQAMYVLVPENGALKPIKLCSMETNNYTDAEPNPQITPNQHWVLFTATFTGISQCYAVEMPKQFWR